MMMMIITAIIIIIIIIINPEGARQAVGEGIGDFVAILQHICTPVVGEMKGL